jgi:hypothetical protein
MLYQPTPHDALNVYRLAAKHNGASSNELEPPSQADVKQTTICAFRILAKERRDARGIVLADRAICLYDRVTCLWFVRFQDGAVLMLRSQDNGFSIVENYRVEN